MQTFTKALIDLVLGDKVDREIAANAASNRHDFLVALERAVKLQAVQAANQEEGADDGRSVVLRPAAPAPAPAEPQPMGLRLAAPQSAE
jgi:hypothetical protein